MDAVDRYRLAAGVLMRAAGTGAGFTLIEMVIAVVILGLVLLIVPLAGTRFMGTVTGNRVRVEANAIADGWISRCRAEPNYDSLTVAARCGTAAGSSVTVGSYNFTRTTTVTPDASLTGVADSLNDFVRITVVVTGGGLTAPVSRTVSIARP